METLLKLVFTHSNRTMARMIVACVMLTGATAHVSATPDEWLPQVMDVQLTSWNFFMEKGEVDEVVPGSSTVGALSCLPDVNISLGQGGFAVITALTLVNAPTYPANQYVVDIMGPLTNTVYCEQIGQELMVVVTELPTNNSCMSTIHVEDKLRPVLVCTSDTLPCNTDIDSIDFESLIESATDNCDENLSLWHSYSIENLSCNPDHFTQKITVTWTATDDYGNSTTCQDVVYLEKPAINEIDFPDNVTVSCVNANTDPSVTGVPTYNGEPVGQSCQILVYPTDQTVLMCPGSKKILRTWTVKDWCYSGQVTHVQEILVVDNTPPVITCPANITVNANAGLCTHKYTLPTPVVSDACAPSNQVNIKITVYGIPGIFSPGQMVTLGLGSTLITMRATDPCGNSSQCMYTVTVKDNLPPVLICPPNVTVGCTSSTLPPTTGTATATDVCDPAPVITYSDVTTASQSCASSYNIMRTWKATDNSGNSITCMQMIAFADVVPPVITCPANVTIQCTASTLPANTGTATATDLCDASPAVTFSDNTVGGSCPQERTINRTWRATDDCGNSSTCVQVIVIDDSIPPVITCPPNVTIECADNSDPGSTGTATASDNCDASPTITHTDVSVPSGPQTFTINRTWKATDDCGNFSTCLQLIVVHDETPPVITCPANVTIQCTASTLPANTGSATATDNCDPAPEISYTDVTTGGTCPQERTITRTWIATDACGNSATCAQSIFVDDSVAPVVTCPANITIQCTASTLPANTGSATATDNCDGTPVVTFTDATVAGACAQERTITRTWRATDDCGNSSTCAQIILIDDSVAPVITCPANVTIECTASTMPANTGTATATDNCNNAPAVTFTDATVAGICAQERTITRTWLATDGCGNSSTCNQTIVVNDSQAPAITCPANVTIQCTASTLPANTGSATATDNCAAAPTVTFSDATLAGGCPQERTITRTWTATDGCGNNTSCIQIIVVDDSLAPVITCPANVTIQCNTSTQPTNTGSATAIDNCDGSPAVIFTDVTAGGGCPQEFVITRTWRATDDCGNSSTCVQMIVIDDSTAPAITCPANITIQCTASTLPANTGTATATDNCDAVPILNFTDATVAGACAQERTITRTWSATDDCGNVSTCAQIIFVDDSTPPAITCPANVTIQCSASTMPANTGSATATDNCDGAPTITFGDVTAANGCSSEGFITRTWVATDHCGNSATCVQIISLDDSQAPAITCPVNVTIECTASTLPANTGTATATDNCAAAPEVTFSDVTVAGGCPQERTINRTWTATDGCGNSTACVQVIVVDDSTAPVITCPANITIQCGENTAPVNTGTATAVDGCDGSPIVTSADVTLGGGGGCPAEYTITRTWTATDHCGNSSSCTQTIFIDDNQAPAITCPANITIECNASTEPGNTGTATATDNCDAVPTLDFSDVTAGNGCPEGYTITRTWSATDDCGNTGTCIQIITVDDNTAPLITCPANVTIECTANTAPANTGSATATDACDAAPTITFSDVTLGGLCPQEHTITRTWSATDDCGNTGTCQQTIVVEDNTAPICAAQNITVSVGGNGIVIVQPSQVDNGSSDNCGPVTLSLAPNTFDCTELGENLVVLTVTDCPGNSSTCTAIVTVEEGGGLQANCQNVTIFIDANGNASVTPGQVDNGSGGGCDPGLLEFDLSQTDFNCADIGQNIVTLTVTDQNGNTATCTAIITVIDAMPPVISCPANITVDCHTVTDPNNTGQYGNATATDNCPGVTITETHVVNLNDCNVGTIVRTFTATDGSGNTATCIQTVTVNNPNPLDSGDITWPPSPASVNICNSTAPENIPNGVPVIDPTALLCADPVITHVDAVQMIVDNNPNTPCKIITRTWTIVDNCQQNGVFVFVQTINVNDPTPPVFTNINDMTKVANSNCVAFFTVIASSTDCAGVSITNNSPYGTNTGANASGNYPIGSTTVIFTATDGCGNTSTMDVVLTVTDPDPTQMQCQKTLVFLPAETEITIPADTFVIFLEGNCTNADDFIISFSGTNPFDTLKTYDCGDVGVSTFSLWMWNEAGTMIIDSCNTADLDLRDPLDFCQDGLALWGNVENEDGLDVSGVEVSILNAPMAPDTTDQSGQYLIEGLNQGIGYNVAPFDDENHREGVSTLDLVLIQKHLLGKARLNSPYKIIAADANKSGNLTAFDLLEIRKLILGITTRFASNTSWRFVDRQFSFADPYNPFTPAFPESIWIDSVSGGIDTADFVGIKIGDVNGSYFLSRASGSQIRPRSGSTYGLSVATIKDQVNGQSRIEVTVAPDQGKIDGLQFSLFAGELTAGQLKDVSSTLLTDDQWFYNPDTRTINVSWSSGTEEELSGKVMLSIPGNNITADIVEIIPSAVTPEAYEVADGGVTVRPVTLSSESQEIVASNEYQLFQNIPNPFSDHTIIRYALPREEKVTLVIHDLTGRQILSREANGTTGINEITIRNRDLGAAGVYYYTLYTPNASFTHKMSFTND